MQTIRGKIYRIIYTNPSNNYTVMDLDVNGEMVSATGIVISPSEGEYLTAEGEWYNHPTYGEQFKIKNITISQPDDRDSILSYLSSGMLRGIGEKKARDLLDHFGTDVLNIIENEPERLREVKGIGKSTAKTVYEDYMEHNEERNVVIALTKYQLTVGAALKLYKKYGGNAVAVVEKNPYRLIEDMYGVGFRKADQIAQAVGIEKSANIRVSAGIKHYLLQGMQRGYTYLPQRNIISTVSKALGVECDIVEENIHRLIGKRELFLDDITSEERRCYLPLLYECEQNCAKRIAKLCDNKPNKAEIEEIGRRIDEYEFNTHITLDPIQKDAVITAATNRLTVITGGPGTGKTTIIRAILYILSFMGRKTALAAPTGRAAKRMQQACNAEARTIHRLLEYGYNPDSGSFSMTEEMFFNRNEENPVEEDTVIIDEMSMVDVVLMSHLMDAIKPTSTLILVGDRDQLPSVGAGCVLSDMIDSNAVQVVKLDKIFRQGSDSSIILNAHRINTGSMPIFSRTDEEFILKEANSQEKIQGCILDMIEKNLFNSRKLIQLEDMKILSPLKKGESGVIELNRKIQQIINPPCTYKQETKIPNYNLREGDKVMQTKNNYTAKWENIHTFAKGEGVFNGDIGYIEAINTESRTVLVVFENERRVHYPFSELENLTLSYAITIHKSQGSEFKSVVIPLYRANPEFLTRNLLYTAVTRAKEQVILIGDRYVLEMMIRNKKMHSRLSGLCERVKNEIIRDS